MLKSVFIEINIVVVVIRVGEKLVFDGEYRRCRNISFWQKKSFWLSGLKYLIPFKSQILSLLVSQIRVDTSITNNFKRSCHPNGSMISSNNQVYFLICNAQLGI